MARTKLKVLRLKIFAAFLLLGIIVSGVIATVLISQQKNVEPATRAAGGECSGDPEADNNGCVNGGGVSNGCNWICQSETAPPTAGAHVPSCCTIVAQTGDPHACCFDALRRCTASQCAAIPEEERQTCGNPPGPCRCGQLWGLGWNCSSGTTNPTNPPQPTIKPPTQTPKPTKKPKPTKQPTVIPTKKPNPTTGGIIPTLEPTLSPVPSLEDEDQGGTPVLVDNAESILPTQAAKAGPSPLLFIGTYIQNFWSTIVDFTRTIAP